MDNTKFIAIIQARLNSSRLPKKILLKIRNETILELIYNNLSKISSIDKIIVATSKNKTDLELVNFCKKKKFNVFKGSLTNVLSRFTKIIKIYKPTHVIRVTADCPIIDSKVLSTYIKKFKKNDLDTLYFNYPTSLLSGYDIYSSNLLLNADKFSKDRKDKEHVGCFYVRRNLKKLKTLKVMLPKFLKTNKYKLSIDTMSDFEKIKKLLVIYGKKPISIKKILKILEKNSGLIIKHSKENFSIHNRILRKIKIDKNKFKDKLYLKL